MTPCVAFFPTVKTLGERLTHAMALRGLKKNELDRKIGQGSGYTTRLARNLKKRPDPDILRRVADELKVSFEWLVFGRGEMTDTTPTETGLSEMLRASLEGVEEPGPNNFERAAMYWGPSVPKEALATVRKRAAGRESTKTPPEWGREIVDEAHKILKRQQDCEVAVEPPQQRKKAAS